MLDKLKNLLGFGEAVDISQLAKDGAIILDVRSKGEYSSGHIKGSINIPLDQLAGNLHKLKDKEKPIITGGASGMRSGSATGLLKSNGYTTVHNGGGWSSLQHKI